ncbi:hypothetical protein [Aquimarina sp. 2201CG5-10]|uniref:hypothetical protein n=1 Tax=Aquimarina callyspongiae TaxID=3098150 RepID=UPI002AB4CC2D|nr:hypothetical protein [Aquimarina sp. 2201CG5-10]MDY8134455.1 hypothetical protein [Aquimarina sp. 2201CG5-10]
MSGSASSIWSTKGRQIICSRNLGTPLPFLIKGVAYSPTPIGQSSIADPLGQQNSAIWQRDLPLIRAMGANSIRIYGMDASNRGNSKEFLDAAWNNGVDPVFAMLSIWISPGGTGIPNLSTLQQQYEWMAEDYGDHPAVIGFSIGSEFNTPTNIQSSTFWSDFNTLTQAVKNGMAKNKGQKLISTGFVDLVVGDAEQTIVEGEANNAGVDVWGIDSYRGDTFTNLWSQVESATSKPFIITEFGAPASYHPTGTSCQASELPSTGTPKMGDLVTYMTSLWQDIENNNAAVNPQKVGSGGYIFEWTDEWWKSPQCGGNDTHAGGSAQNGSFPGGWDDEEWFGLNSVAAGSPNVITQRPTYTYFESIWNQ